jgi:flavin reductase (DIM6/NTAB) family NADH-FMN oxidoreductase RutF
MTLQQEVDKRAAFIDAMRGVANSVTIVTTDGPAGRRGATVSAFTSVSADPPMVLVCLHRQSTIAALVKANGVFCVNVLSQGAADLARRFAGAMETPWDGLDYVGPDAPRLPGATTFVARVASVTAQGSHLIIVGEVEQTVASGARPLIYLDGAFLGEDSE